MFFRVSFKKTLRGYPDELIWGLLKRELLQEFIQELLKKFFADCLQKIIRSFLQAFHKFSFRKHSMDFLKNVSMDSFQNFCTCTSANQAFKIVPEISKTSFTNSSLDSVEKPPRIASVITLEILVEVSHWICLKNFL